MTDHDWQRDEKRSRRQHRVSVCSRCKLVREDRSCRGRYVRYLLDGKTVDRVPPCVESEA